MTKRHWSDLEMNVVELTLARIVGLGNTAGRDGLVLGLVGDVGELDVLGEGVSGLEGGGHRCCLLYLGCCSRGCGNEGWKLVGKG